MLLPKGFLFPQHVIYNSLGNVSALQNQALSNQKQLVFFPLTPFSSRSSSEGSSDTHIKGFYFKINPQGNCLEISLN